MLGSFLFLYIILTLYGTFLLYRDVAVTGCDPSGAVVKNETCNPSGPDVFGAMLGVAFAAQGVSQIGSFLEVLTAARVAVYQALLAIDRAPGSPQQTIYKASDDRKQVNVISDPTGEDDHIRTNDVPTPNSSGEDIEKGVLVSTSGDCRVQVILPKFEIDSYSESGMKPNLKGKISFHNVEFAYPTRPGVKVLRNLNLEIEPGSTVCLVGPSGGGKSSIVGLIERFYDPNAGKVCIDGIDLKDMNVTDLRRSIGYVGQVRFLFWEL